MIFPSVTEHRLRGQDQFAQNATSLSVQLLKKIDPIAGLGSFYEVLDSSTYQQMVGINVFPQVTLIRWM